MERIGVRELRQHASKYLESVKQGKTVEVTERGTLVARLVPPTGPQSARDRLIADGRLSPATRPSTTLPEPVATDPDGPTTDEILDDLRQDRV